MAFVAAICVKFKEGTSSLASSSDYHFRIWFLRLKEFKEIRLVKLLICIHIYSSDDSELVCLSGLDSNRIEKTFKVLLVNQSHTNIINVLKRKHLLIALLRF